MQALVFLDSKIYDRNLAFRRGAMKPSMSRQPVSLERRPDQDQQGTDRWTTEVVLKAFNGQIVLLGGNQREAPTEESYGAGATTRPQSSATGGGRKIEDMNDDVPFSCEWR